jgi:hypothetical protein
VIWIAVAFCVVALVASPAYAGARAWRLWRAFRRTSRRATDALGRVSASAAAAEAHAVALSSGTERLAAAAGRLRQALDELEVIRAAAAEPRALLASIRGTVPRK